jgi:putative membrane protein
VSEASGADNGQTPRSRADADSRARTHLANERTFLAWLRTGLSLVAVGLAAARFLPLHLLPGVPFVTVFSALLVLSGTAIVIFGAYRHTRASREIDRGSYNPGVWPMVLVAALISLLGAMGIVLVFLLR